MTGVYVFSVKSQTHGISNSRDAFYPYLTQCNRPLENNSIGMSGSKTYFTFHINLLSIRIYLYVLLLNPKYLEILRIRYSSFSESTTSKSLFRAILSNFLKSTI